MAEITEYVPGRSTPGKLADVNLEQILDRIASGELPAYIADELQVSRPALHYRLKAHPGYQIAREIHFDMGLDAGLHEISSSKDLNSARMAEIKLRRLEWRAEREFPSRWGQKTSVNIDIGDNLAQALADARDRVRSVVAAQPLQRTIEHNQVEDAQVVDCKSD